MANLNRSQFKFKRHDSIGTEAAEQDEVYLRDCFVDTGDLSVLRDTHDLRRVVVGRTGTGKTALLLLLSTREEHVAWIEPDQLSLSYLVNSTILRHLDRLGVNLDLFYKLLWRHIFAVELIQLKWGLRSEADQKGFFSRILEKFGGDKRKEEALSYLKEWGTHFWKDTEYRVHEVTTTLENQLRASLGGQLSLFQVGVNDEANVSLADKKEIVHRAQEVVNHVQIQKLSKIIDILAEDVFDDEQQRYFVLIDRLDENWVPDPVRFKLIRALIETVRDLQKIRNAKLVVAIRKDLLQRVFNETRDAGFQEEKYQALYLPLTWTSNALMSVMDKRLNRLVRHRFSARPISWQDLFPAFIGQARCADYLVDRTMYRPRDIIQFCNCCIERAPDRPEITAQIVREAEAQYSTLRLRSLCDEWALDYPELLSIVETLKHRRPLFHISEIKQDQLDGLCVDELTVERPSALLESFKRYYDGAVAWQELRARVVRVFYETGIVGVKGDVAKPVSWSFLEPDVLGGLELSDEVRLAVCPMLFRALATDLS